MDTIYSMHVSIRKNNIKTYLVFYHKLWYVYIFLGRLCHYTINKSGLELQKNILYYVLYVMRRQQGTQIVLCAHPIQSVNITNKSMSFILTWRGVVNNALL
jgi:hypothetical protein